MTQLDLLSITTASCSEPSGLSADAAGEIINDSDIRPIVGRTTAADQADQAEQADPFRRDADGWQRYRGPRGRRGPLTAAQLADEALRMALDELTGAREELAAAYAIPTSERRARREAFASALSKVALATRFCDEVLMQHNRQPWDCEAA